MSRTIKDASVKRFRHNGPRVRVLAFVTARDRAKHLKALRWRTPFQAIRDAQTRDPSVRNINPNHPIPGPHD